MEILKVQNLCKTYGKGEAKVVALKTYPFHSTKGNLPLWSGNPVPAKVPF